MSARHSRIVNSFNNRPGWVDSLIWVGVVYLLFRYLLPGAELMLDQPVVSVVVIGAVVFLVFLSATVYDWRHGSEMVGEVRRRILLTPGEPDEPMVAVWIVFGLLIAIWLAVVFTAIGMVGDPDETHRRAMLILILGGLTAGIGAPFLVLPTILLLGLVKGAEIFDVSFRLRLAASRSDALAQRADLSRMPAPSGLGHPVEISDAPVPNWRSRPVSLFNILARLGTSFTVERAAGDRLIITALSDTGDREVLGLVQVDDTLLEARVTEEVRGAWARGVLLFAGREGMSRMISTIEAARQSRMLGTEVEVEDLTVNPS